MEDVAIYCDEIIILIGQKNPKSNEEEGGDRIFLVWDAMKRN